MGAIEPSMRRSGTDILSRGMSMRHEFTRADRPGRRTAAIVTLCLLGSLFSLAVIAPGFQDWAAVLMLAAVIAFVAAFALARRVSSTRP